MITPEEKQKIKEVLGHRYGNAVKEYIDNCGLINSKGKPYSLELIRNTMNGIHHETIEVAIFELVRLKKIEIEQRKSILK